MFPFPSFDQIMNTLRQLPLPWVGRLLPGRPHPSPMPLPKQVQDDAQRLTMQEKILARIAAGGKKIFFLPLLDSYTEETEKMRLTYRLMLREPVVKAALLTKVLGVAHLDLQVQPASERPVDKIAAELVKASLEGCRGGTRTIAMNILFPGLIDGFSVSEKRILVEERGKWDGYHLLKQLKSKDTKHLRLLGDDYRNITAVQDIRTTIEYHPSNFVIWQHLPLFESPTGMSDLRAAYRAYQMLDTVTVLRAIALERYSLPMMVGEYSHPDYRNDLETALENARSQTWVSLPLNCKITALDIAARGPSDFEAATASLREEIVLGITGAMLQILSGDVPNGAGDSQVHKSTSELLQWYLAASLGDVITDQIVPDLVEMNFQDAEYPRVTFGGTNDAALLPSIELDAALSQLGLDLDMDELYKRYGRQKPKTPERTLFSPQSLQKQQMDQQMQMQAMGMQQQAMAPGQQAAAAPDESDNDQDGDGGLQVDLPEQPPDGDGGTPGIVRTEKREEQPRRMSEGGSTIQNGLQPQFMFPPASGKDLAEARAVYQPNGLATEKASIRKHSETQRQAAVRLQGPVRLGPPDNPWQFPDSRFADKGKHINRSKLKAIIALRRQRASKFSQAAMVSVFTPGVGGGRTKKQQKPQSFADDFDVDPGTGQYIGLHKRNQSPGLLSDPVHADAGQHGGEAPANNPEEPEPFSPEVPGNIASRDNFTSNIFAEQDDATHLTLDGQAAGHVANPQDWSTFKTWLNQLDPIQYPELAWLNWYGKSDNLPALQRQLVQAIHRQPTNRQVMQTAGRLSYLVGMRQGRQIGTLSSGGEFDQPEAIDQTVFLSEDNGHEQPSKEAAGQKEVPGKGAEPSHQEGHAHPDVSGPHADAEKAQKLLNAAKAHGTNVLADITRQAVKRMLERPEPMRARRLFNDAELEKLANTLADVKSTANLLGQSKTYIQAEHVAKHAEKFSEGDPTDFSRFADGDGNSTIQPMRPERAVAYFQGLVPKLNVQPGRFGPAMQRDAFTVAKATDAEVLDRIKEAIRKTLETGEDAGGRGGAGITPSGIVAKIDTILDDAGVSRRNPQYSEMLYRSNMMDAYQHGTIEAMQDPDVSGVFPVWKYSGIIDGRQRIEHQAHFGKFFTNKVAFAEVRDSVRLSPWNCRCVPTPISKYQWKRLQEGGATAHDNPDLEAARAFVQAHEAAA